MIDANTDTTVRVIPMSEYQRKHQISDLVHMGVVGANTCFSPTGVMLM